MGHTRTLVRPAQIHTNPAARSDGWAVLDALSFAYERGWLPADLIHVTRQSLGTAEVRLAASAILYHADVCRLYKAAPVSWLRQLRNISDQLGERSLDASTPIQRSALSALWRGLPSLSSVGYPPPSAWPRVRAPRRRGNAGRISPLVLAEVESLLQKAEAASFGEEAETFTAAAQTVLSRHSAAARPGRGVEPTINSRHFHIEAPFASEKLLLLTSIAAANQARVAWHAKVGIATVVGTTLSLNHTAILFQSLKVQAQHALGSTRQKGKTTIAQRKSFLYGYAVRMGVRLALADRNGARQAADAGGPATGTVEIYRQVDTRRANDELKRLLARYATAEDPGSADIRAIQTAAAGRTLPPIAARAG
jgi:hypothetical protein